MENEKIFNFELNFFSVLQKICKKTSLYLRIPDTIILGFGFESATLFTTDLESGKLIIKTKLSPDAVQEAFTYFSELETDPIFPISVYKTSKEQDSSSSRVIFSAPECFEAWIQPVKTGKCVQKFLRNSACIELYNTNWDNVESKIMIKRLVKHKNVRTLNETNKRVPASTKRKMIAKEMKVKVEREKFLILNTDKELKEKVMNVPEIERKMIYLVYVFERFYLQDPNLKVLSFEADWMEDTNGDFYLVSVKRYRIARIKAIKQTISLFQIPKDIVPIPKARACISFSKKIRKIKKSQSSKLSKSCTILNS